MYIYKQNLAVDPLPYNIYTYTHTDSLTHTNTHTQTHTHMNYIGNIYIYNTVYYIDIHTHTYACARARAHTHTHTCIYNIDTYINIYIFKKNLPAQVVLVEDDIQHLLILVDPQDQKP
jgi:hypothetical protein